MRDEFGRLDRERMLGQCATDFRHVEGNTRIVNVQHLNADRLIAAGEVDVDGIADAD